MSTTVNKHKEVIMQLCDIIKKEQEQIRIAAPDREAWLEVLDKTKEKQAEKFTILIMGTFSSGKSSMINAFIGEDLLPVGFLPETAVIGELHYSTRKSITMYPKKGKWKGGDAPFQLEKTTSDEISKYASIDNEGHMNCKSDASGRIESTFEKMVITWPLEILKDGVVIVDSPGTNDPYSNDKIVQSYIPRADAMIYLMKGLDAYTMDDKKALEDINKVGIQNIVFGITYFDMVCQTYKGKDSKMQSFLNVIRSNCKNHTNLGDEGIHFIASLDGLKAKLTGDQELWVKSGYDGLEKYIQKYLVENKGRAQVKNIAETIRHTAQDMEKEAAALNASSQKSAEDVKKDIDRANKELDIARNDAENVRRNFHNAMDNLREPARNRVREFIGGVANEIDLEGFEPAAELPTGLGKLNPVASKKAAEDMKDEYQKEFNRRLNKRTNEWVATRLSAYIQQETEMTAKKMRQSLEDFAAQLNRIDSVMIGEDVNVNVKDTGSVALGLGYAILTGDWFTGGMSAVYGKGAFARSIGFQAAAGAALGIALLAGAPVTLPVVALAAIGSSILAVLTSNNEKKGQKIKKKVVETCREAYTGEKEHQKKMVDAIMENVDCFIDKVCMDMDEALRTDINNKQSMIQKTLDSLNEDMEAKKTEMRRREQAVCETRKLLAEVDQICAAYGI